jgi:hypothetical protein
MEADYRIEFSIQRRLESEEDFTEVGFGSGGEGGTVADALYGVESVVQNKQWETGEGMPEPDSLEGGTDE